MMSRGLRVLIGLAAAMIVLVGLERFSSVAGPAFLALTLTIAVSPLRSWMRRRGAPGWALVAVPLTVVLLGMIAFVAALVVSVAQLAVLLPTYSDEYTALAASATRWLRAHGITSAEVNAVLGSLDPSQLLPIVQGFLSSLLSVGSAFVLILLLLYGMSLDAGPIQSAANALETTRPHLVRALRDFTGGTCRYLVVSTVFGLIVAVLDAGALLLLGVPLPLLWGLLAFITNYIPNIGFVLGLVPPALLALLDSGWVTMTWVIAVYSVLNFVIQSVIQPKYAGQSAGLSTTITILSLLIWSVVLGALGAVLAVPLTALARALLIDADPGTRWAIPLVSGQDRQEPPTPRGGTSGTRRSSG
ncbi:AI-2E family transporter [Nonomuraea dietziae]|uniref:Putative PurR-regulated permease PerM n=1 Tax=Nonomuraea dietziae TaxID=65515 RepID=A0A7W5V4I7_9ACTN|nr:AI-2E family transporter [Nonomuraea dietziae]MBB3727220.1 putative PurR-regulated permease PerM [Nonomuraea dietziae]